MNEQTHVKNFYYYNFLWWKRCSLARLTFLWMCCNIGEAHTTFIMSFIMNQKTLTMGAQQFRKQVSIYFYWLLGYCSNTVRFLTNNEWMQNLNLTRTILASGHFSFKSNKLKPCWNAAVSLKYYCHYYYFFACFVLILPCLLFQ